MTIDQVLDELGIETADFMKLDVEGNESAALRGAGRSLAAKRIKALSFEFGSGNANSRTFFHEFWDLLQPLGYTIHRIWPGGNSEHPSRSITKIWSTSAALTTTWRHWTGCSGAAGRPGGARGWPSLEALPGLPAHPGGIGRRRAKPRGQGEDRENPSR